MYFLFRVRPVTWPMRVVAAGVVLTMWLCIDAGWIFVALEYIWRSDDKLSPVWARLALPLGPIPVCYMAAFVCWIILALIDKARFRVSGIWSDLRYAFSLPHWLDQNFGNALIFVPVLIFAVTVLLSKAPSVVPVHSTMAINLTFQNMQNGPERYQFVRPMLFPLNETTTLSLQHTAGTHRGIYCSLSAPNVDVEPVPIGDRSQLLANGVATEVPDCLWIVTARRSGSQKAILKISFLEPDTDGDLYIGEAPKEITDVESFYVAGGLFTFQNLFVLVMAAIVFAGLLRLRRVGAKQMENVPTQREPLKIRTPNVRMKVESKLYEGETKLK